MGRGLLESFLAKEMLAYQHSGFSVDAGVCIEAHDRAALKRLLRCCATSLLRNFATAPAHPLPWIALAKKGAALVYRCAKQRSAPTSDKPGAKVDELHLTLLELIDRIAALMPPPRTHRRKRCHCPSSLRKPSWVRVRQSRACRRSAHLPTTCGQC